MKKLLLLITVMMLGLIACSKEDEPGKNNSSDQKSCWIFTSKIVTSISPSMEGYPQTTTSEVEQCGLTEKEASAVATRLTTTTSSSAGEYTVTIKTTTTKKKK